jgi:hypothetical protein
LSHYLSHDFSQPEINLDTIPHFPVEPVRSGNPTCQRIFGQTEWDRLNIRWNAA